MSITSASNTSFNFSIVTNALTQTTGEEITISAFSQTLYSSLFDNTSTLFSASIGFNTFPHETYITFVVLYFLSFVSISTLYSQ
jgi:hypothetical protein